MGPAETAGIVVITVAVTQGLINLVKYLIDKRQEEQAKKAEQELIKNDEKIIDMLDEIKAKVGTDCGLNELQSSQLRELYDLHSRVDPDGVPLWYVPRGWAETQKDIVERLQKITETEYKMLGIIERLERRLEIMDNKSK